MSRTADRIMEHSEYYHLNKKKIWRLGVALLFVVVLFSIFFITKTVTAQRAVDRTKLVTCIEVKKGDSLWSIASEYYTDEYDDMNEYIAEIMSSNGMISDEIHAGNFIIVPYYTEATESTFTMK